MPGNLEGVIANIPGYAGYRGSEELNQRRQLQELQQAGILEKIITAGRANQLATAFRGELGALGPDATDEQRSAVALKYGAPKDIITHADTRARVQANQEIAMARLTQAAQTAAANLSIKDRNATTAEQKAQVAAERAGVENWYQRSAMQIKRGEAAYALPPGFLGAGEAPPATGGTAPPASGVAPTGVPTAAQAAPGIPPQDLAAFNIARAGGTATSQRMVPPEEEARMAEIPAPAPQGAPQPAPAQPIVPTSAPMPDAANLDARDLQARGGVPQPIAAAPVPTPAEVPVAPTAPARQLSQKALDQIEIDRRKTLGKELPPLTGSSLVTAGSQHASGMPLMQIAPGYSRNMGDRRDLIRQEAIRQIKAQNPGMDDIQAGEELANRGVALKASQASVTQLEKMKGATDQAVMQLDFNVDKVTQAIDKLSKTLGGEDNINLSPLFTAMACAVRKWTGDPAYSELYYFMFAAG